MNTAANPAPLRLGVNIDHVATVREARGTAYPDVVQAGLLAQAAGADGITVHLREDRRHIQDSDLTQLLKTLTVPLNLEMAATDDMLAIACREKPPHCCLVPERRQELTTEGGLDVVSHSKTMRDACLRLGAAGVRVSLFIAPDPRQLDAALAVRAPAVEIHTGRYADAHDPGVRLEELNRIRDFARAAAAAGLEVHAGHGLNLNNVGPIAAIPDLRELNIGHSIISHALFVGLNEAVRAMRRAMDADRK